MAVPTVTPDAILPPESEAARARAELLARLLDTRFEVPGLGIRFGWDAIIGLLPGVGDLLSALLSFVIILEAIRLHAPNALIARMLANSIADGALGGIPIAGDLADVAFKANRRNAGLLLEWMKRPEEVSRRSRAVAALAVLGALTALVGTVALAIYALRLIFQAASSGS
jgi:hypothetical protein